MPPAATGPTATARCRHWPSAATERDEGEGYPPPLMSPGPGFARPSSLTSLRGAPLALVGTTARLPMR